jgi:hypothetical protein
VNIDFKSVPTFFFFFKSLWVGDKGLQKECTWALKTAKETWKAWSNLDLFLSEERLWPRPPEELTESLQGLLDKQLALEVPDPEGVVHLSTQQLI